MMEFNGSGGLMNATASPMEEVMRLQIPGKMAYFRAPVSFR
jgi:hypothetical protein